MPPRSASASLVDLREILARVASGQAPPPAQALAAAVAGRLRAAAGGSLVEVHVDRGALVVPWLAHDDGPSLGRAMESAWWHRGDRTAATDVDLEARLGPAVALLPSCPAERALLLSDAEGWHYEIRIRRRAGWAAELAAPLAPFAALAASRTHEGLLRVQQTLGAAGAAYGAVLAALYPGLPSPRSARAGEVLAGLAAGAYTAPEPLQSLDALVATLDGVIESRRPALLVGLLGDVRPKSAKR